MSAQRHRRHRRDTRTGLLRLQAPNGQLDLSEGKRLSQVVGRAEPDGLGGGGWRPAATRDNDPNAGVRRLRRSQYIQSIGAWHQDVCHDEPVAIGLALKGADRRVAVCRGGDRELELLEQVHQQFPNISVVIDDQHIRHCEAPVSTISRVLIGHDAVSSNSRYLVA